MGGMGSTGENETMNAAIGKDTALVPPHRPHDPRYGVYTGSSRELMGYQDQLMAARAQQMGAGEMLYGGATAPSNIQAQAARGQALQQQLGGLGGGGLEALRAMQGAGQASYGVGADASRQGFEARQQAGQALMAAQARQAEIEHAMMQSYMQRGRAEAAAQARVNAARQAKDAAAEQEAMQIMGAGASAGAAGISAYRQNQQEQYGKDW